MVYEMLLLVSLLFGGEPSAHGLALEGLAAAPASTRVIRPLALPAKPAAPSFAQRTRALARDLGDSYGIGAQRARRFAQWIMDAAHYANLDPHVLAALVAVESSFRTEVTSHAGAIGPAQVIPRYWTRFCPGDLSEPADNIRCGAIILGYYRITYCDGELACALRLYNVGPHGVRAAEGRAAAERYLHKVTAGLDALAHR